jgi:hypothetical protein
MQTPEQTIKVHEPREGVAFRVKDEPPLDRILLHDPDKPFRDHYVHGDYHLVDSKFYAELMANPLENQKILDACFPFRFYHVAEKDGKNFLWPVRLPKEDEEMDPFWAAKHRAAQFARKVWVEHFPDEHSN